MKKRLLSAALAFVLLVMPVGCGDVPNEGTTATEEAAITATSATDVAAESGQPPTEEENAVAEGDVSCDLDVIYGEQIARYHTALSEKWDEGKYFENGMSALPYYYYAGNPVDNVGFGFVDLDKDGCWELVIGAIQNAERDPAVFEIWTLVDGAPVMLVQGGSRNRYVLAYVEEDDMWYVVNEASNSAFNHATYYLMLNAGALEVVQGIVFDASADEQNPWFMTYDLDWDVSNDEPIDEETADAILESNRKHYAAPAYFPYAFYQSE